MEERDSFTDTRSLLGETQTKFLSESSHNLINGMTGGLAGERGGKGLREEITRSNGESWQTLSSSQPGRGRWAWREDMSTDWVSELHCLKQTEETGCLELED